MRENYQHKFDRYAEGDYIVTGDPGDMIFGTYLMGLCLLDSKLASKKDANPNPLFMKLESDWRVFADYMIYKVSYGPTRDNLLSSNYITIDYTKNYQIITSFNNI